MISELKIEGFKSFGMGAHPMPLGPLTFLVGANAAGKTNVISALRFLRTAVGYNEIEFARSIAPKFSPSRARGHSASFQHCWDRIEATCRKP